MEQARPLQLLSFDRSSGQFRLHNEAAEAVKSIRKPLSVVALAGRSRTGKSYLMNRIAGAAPGNGFRVAATSTAVTSGLWLWSQPVDMGSHAVILLDTEGMDDTASDAQYDTKLFALVVLVASTLLFNVHHNLDRSSLERLNQVAFCSKTVYKSCDVTGKSAEGSELPELHIVVRDWELLTEHAPREWLEAKLLPDTSGASTFSNVQEHRDVGGYKEQITKYFPRRDATIMPYPLAVTKESDIQNLKDLPSTHLKPEFENAVQQLINKIRGQQLPKKILGGGTVDGPKMMELLTHYVQAINDDKCPDLGDGMRAIEHAIGLRAMELANKTFDDAAKQFVQNLSSLGVNQLNALLSKADEAQHELLQRSLKEFEAHASNISGLMKEKFRLEITDRAHNAVKMLKYQIESLALKYTLRDAQDMNEEQMLYFQEALKSAEENHKKATEKYQAEFADQAARMQKAFDKEVAKREEEARRFEERLQVERARERVNHQAELAKVKSEMESQLKAAQAIAAQDRRVAEENTQRILKENKKKIEKVEREHNEKMQRWEHERELDKMRMAEERRRMEEENQRTVARRQNDVVTCPPVYHYHPAPLAEAVFTTLAGCTIQ